MVWRNGRNIDVSDIGADWELDEEVGDDGGLGRFGEGIDVTGILKRSPAVLDLALSARVGLDAYSEELWALAGLFA